MKITFTTINKKVCTNDFQKKLWNGAEEFAKNNVIHKLQKSTHFLGDLHLNILIDMTKGASSIIKNDLTDEQFLTAQRALQNKL